APHPRSSGLRVARRLGRRLAYALSGLARHPLRGQGAARGPPPRLPDLPSYLIYWRPPSAGPTGLTTSPWRSLVMGATVRRRGSAGTTGGRRIICALHDGGEPMRSLI